MCTLGLKRARGGISEPGGGQGVLQRGALAGAPVPRARPVAVGSSALPGAGLDHGLCSSGWARRRRRRRCRCQGLGSPPPPPPHADTTAAGSCNRLSRLQVLEKERIVDKGDIKRVTREIQVRVHLTLTLTLTLILTLTRTLTSG